LAALTLACARDVEGRDREGAERAQARALWGAGVETRRTGKADGDDVSAERSRPAGRGQAGGSGGVGTFDPWRGVSPAQRRDPTWLDARVAADPSVPSVARIARDAFDTRGALSDPLGDDSPLRRVGVTGLPRELFFVLRTVQLLRGLKGGLLGDDLSRGEDWSACEQWRGLASARLREGPEPTKRDGMLA